MILQKIFEYKQEELSHYRRCLSFLDLKNRVRDCQPTLDFPRALLESQQIFSIIAEVKHRSPSKGVIREDFHPVSHARDYAEHGAAALSILTDEHFFGGSLDYLRDIRAQVTLPLLRKDFLWDPYQIYAARDAGADAILLIAAMLEDSQMEDLQGLSRELGMAALIEVHDLHECERVLPLAPSLVGINNRNLQTFEVDLKISEFLLPALANVPVRIAESGLEHPKDLRRLRQAGAQAFLIGESFMRAPHPGKALAAMLSAQEEHHESFKGGDE